MSKHRKLDLLVESDELEEKTMATPVPIPEERELYQEHVSQVDLGYDFDFLLGTPGETREPDAFEEP